MGYDFLADTLQSAAHKSYSTLLAERTLSPMKMYQTTFFPSAAQCARLLIGAHDEGSCASTEATDGSSGLYSTPADMAIWLKYLLGTGGPAIPLRIPPRNKATSLLQVSKATLALTMPGAPTSIGLGWLHLLPPGDPSHIVEKTGGGADSPLTSPSASPAILPFSSPPPTTLPNRNLMSSRPPITCCSRSPACHLFLLTHPDNHASIPANGALDNPVCPVADCRGVVVHNQNTMALLWNPESWSQRLAELEAQSGDLKEAPLRRDVRSLGTLLGEVLREQAGDELFAHVEALRQGTIRRRDAEAHGHAEEAARHAAAALELVHSLPVERAILLTRAFAFYFELINLAETNHRKRRRIALRLSGQAGRQRGSLDGTLCEMRRVGIGAEEALDWLAPRAHRSGLHRAPH